MTKPPKSTCKLFFILLLFNALFVFACQICHFPAASTPSIHTTRSLCRRRNRSRWTSNPT
ncbi:hypothetical protein GLYMA_12G151800v4 [Glycine max]|nr:hypothetical protein GLYMA_12G151800v4 [Glycine max]KAH1143298.1 hypothetical protein GYH30_033824 [Glycine max]